MYKFNPNFYADIRIEDRFATNVLIKNGKLDEAKETTEVKAFIRVFDGKMWYYTSTVDIDNIQQALDELYGYATPNPDIANNAIVARYQVNKDTKLRFTDCSVRNVPLADKIKLVADTGAKLVSPMSNIINARYIDRNSLYKFYSSKGADITYDFQTAGESYAMGFTKGEETMYALTN